MTFKALIQETFPHFNNGISGIISTITASGGLGKRHTIKGIEEHLAMRSMLQS